MAFDVLIPQMGESVLEGTILEWKVKVGDKVKLNQPLVELMTDKVNIEIPSEVEGILTHQFVKEGDVVPVGTRIAIIDDGSKDSSEATTETSVSSAVAPRKPPQATTTASSSQSQMISKSVDIKATAAIGKGKMSPKVKMLIRQYSLDPSTIVPTGKEGRVLVDDVMRAVEERAQSAGFTPMPSPVPSLTSGKEISPVTSSDKSVEAPKEPLVKVEIPRFEPLPMNQRERRIPFKGVRKIISDHMVKSKKTSPHVTTFEDFDLTELAIYRNKIKDSFLATYGAKITFMPFIVKAVCLGLKEFPKLNASLTEKEIVYKNYYNIGVAVAREEGLIVPIIKDADKKSIIELAIEINDLGNRARNSQLTPDDVSGGTFSITNAGMFGAASSTPIINQPQVAILGVHAIIKKPWVVNDEIVIRYISNFGLSFDHRLIDGHVAVQFLHRVHEYLADIHKMLLFLR